MFRSRTSSSCVNIEIFCVGVPDRSRTNAPEFLVAWICVLRRSSCRYTSSFSINQCAGVPGRLVPKCAGVPGRLVFLVNDAWRSSCLNSEPEFLVSYFCFFVVHSVHSFDRQSAIRFHQCDRHLLTLLILVVSSIELYITPHGVEGLGTGYLFYNVGVWLQH